MTTDATDKPPAGPPLELSLHDQLGPAPSETEQALSDLNAAVARGHAEGLTAAERERKSSKAALWLLATVCLWA